MGFQQIQAPTLRELFVDQVIGMIFSGELRVGDRLPSERELSEQMHISRSMVHTGLEDLERMGFVRMEPRRGNYIEDYARHGNFETLMALGKYGGQFDHAIESSLVEARDAIEGGAMILLGERGTPADIDQLRAITDGLRASLPCSPRAAAATLRCISRISIITTVMHTQTSNTFSHPSPPMQIRLTAAAVRRMTFFGVRSGSGCRDSRECCH